MFRDLPMTIILCLASLLALQANATTVYVDASKGDDSGPGTQAKPWRSLTRSLSLLDESHPQGLTVRIAAGNYVLNEGLVLDRGSFSAKNPLRFEAAILPDRKDWKPADMPVIRSVENPGPVEGRGKAIYGFRVKISNVAFQGLKFLGNPAVGHRYYPIRREGRQLDNLHVSQCVFLGDRERMPIHVAVIGQGDGIVLEHNLFNDCRNPVVYWFSEGGIAKSNAMRYCIAHKSYQSGLWTSDTQAGFSFHNNVFSQGGVFHMRRGAAEVALDLSDSVIVGFEVFNRATAGPGGVAAAKAKTVSYRELGVTKEGEVILELDSPQSRNYLHVKPGTPGSELGAGLFTGTKKNDEAS